MQHPKRRPVAFALVFLVLLAAACQSKEYKAEVVSGAGREKTVIKVACSDEAFVVFQKLADKYASRHGLQFEVFQTQSASADFRRIGQPRRPQEYQRCFGRVKEELPAQLNAAGAV